MKVATAYALAWISTGLAVSIGIYITKDVAPLWAMLIPACISFSSDNNEKTTK